MMIEKEAKKQEWKGIKKEEVWLSGGGHKIQCEKKKKLRQFTEAEILRRSHGVTSIAGTRHLPLFHVFLTNTRNMQIRLEKIHPDVFSLGCHFCVNAAFKWE